MRKTIAVLTLLLVLLLVFAGDAGKENRSVEELLRLRTPAPNFIIVMDASEDLLSQQERCVGCYRTQRVTEKVTREYTYSLASAAEDRSDYIQDAIRKFRRYVQNNYTNPTISNLKTSSWVTTSGSRVVNLYLSTALAGPAAYHPVPYTRQYKWGDPPLFVPYGKAARRVETLTLFPLTSWQAYHVFDVDLRGYNKQRQGEYTYFSPTLTVTSDVSFRIFRSDCECSLLLPPFAEGTCRCKIRRMFFNPYCSGRSIYFGPNGPSRAALARALMEMTGASRDQAKQYAQDIISSRGFKQHFPGARAAGPLRAVYAARAAARIYYMLERKPSTPQGRSILYRLTFDAPDYIKLPKYLLDRHSKICFPHTIQQDPSAPNATYKVNYYVATAGVLDPQQSSVNVTVKRGEGKRTWKLRYSYVYYQPVRIPARITLHVRVSADVSYDKRVYDPCCWTEIVKDETPFIEFKNAVRDWILQKKRQGVEVAFTTFVSGGKAETGSVLLHGPQAGPQQIEQAFNSLKPAGVWAAALSVAEVLRFLKGKSSVSRREGAPLPEMNIPPSPSTYTNPYKAWCQNSYIVVISAGADASSRSSSIYGDLRCGDYDGDGRESASADWSQMLDDIAAYLKKEDIRPQLRHLQRVRTFVITYKYSDTYHEHTAQQGGGRHFHATSPPQLLSALDQVLAAVLRAEASMRSYISYFVPFHSDIFPYAVRYGYRGFDSVLELRRLEGGLPSQQVEADLAKSIPSSRRRLYAIWQGRLAALEELAPSAFGLRSQQEKQQLLQVIRESFPPVVAIDVLYSPTYINRPGKEYALSVVIPYQRSGAPPWWILFVLGSDGSLHVINKQFEEVATIYPQEALSSLAEIYLQGASLGDKAYGLKVATQKVGEGEFEDVVFFHYAGSVYRLSCEAFKQGRIPDSAERYAAADRPAQIKFYPTKQGDVLVVPGSVKMINLDGQVEELEVDAAGVYSVDLNADGLRDYMYITTRDGRILRYGFEDGQLHTLFEGGEAFSGPPTVAGTGRPGRRVFVAAVSGDYEQAIAGRIYGFVDDFSGRTYRADELAQQGGWVAELPADSYPMPWASPVVFNALLYVPVVKHDPDVPFCSLCLQADTLVYTLAGGFVRKINDTLSPETVLHYDRRSRQVKGYVVSAGRQTDTTVHTEIAAPEKLYRYIGHIYLTRPRKQKEK